MDHKESPQELIKPIIELFSNGQIQEAYDGIEILIKKYPLLKNYNLNQAIKNNILEHTTQIIDFTNQPKQIQQQTIQTITQSNHIHKQDILNYLTNKEENQL